MPLLGANNKAPRNPRDPERASRVCTRDKEYGQLFCFLEFRKSMTCSPGRASPFCSVFSMQLLCPGIQGIDRLVSGWKRLTLPPLFGGSS